MNKIKYLPPNLGRLTDREKTLLVYDIATALFSCGEVTNEHWHPDGWQNRVVNTYNDEDVATLTVEAIVGLFRRYDAVPVPAIRITTIAPFAVVIDPDELFGKCEMAKREHPLGVWPYHKAERLCRELDVKISRDDEAPEYVDFGGFDD